MSVEVRGSGGCVADNGTTMHASCLIKCSGDANVITLEIEMEGVLVQVVLVDAANSRPTRMVV